MKKYDTIGFILIVFIVLFYGCASQEITSDDNTNVSDVLFINEDGSMEFRGRNLNPDEVIIYPDGYGGERAAIILRVPLRPKKYEDSTYFRDTIRVERLTGEDENHLENQKD